MAKEHVCPKCGSSLNKTKALSGNDSTFWRECSNPFCGSLVDTFKPTIMQHNFLKDHHKRKATFGGFGSGKSAAIIKDVVKHCLITPKAYVGVIGFTFRLIKRNFQKDFEEDTPVYLMQLSQGQKTPGYNSSDNVYTFKNGSKIELITADNEGKIRGLNATKIVFLEASNIKNNVIETAKSRLRNTAAAKIRQDINGKDIYRLDEKTGEMVPDIEVDWINMTFESNPDAGAIYKEFLLKCEYVQFYGSSYNKYPYRLRDIDDEFSAHISATDSNPYLPPNYLEINTKNKPIHEVKRFYYGSFLFSENMIYPRVNEIIVDRYPIDFDDPNVFVLVGMDYGLSDICAYTFSAINFKKNLITVYDELGVNNMDVKEIATEYRKKLSQIPDGKLLFVPKMDAKSYSKRGADKKTIGQLFEEVGLLFEGIQEGHEVRTLKLNSLINNGQIHIFRDLVGLTGEITEYKFLTNNKGEVTDKRMDKNNHYIDSLEFALIKLPINLEKMKIEEWIKPGHYVMADKYRKRAVVELTRQQVVTKAIDPFNFGRPTQQSYQTQEYTENEMDDIISKLSGI